jgi:hypothetical protein
MHLKNFIPLLFPVLLTAAPVIEPAPGFAIIKVDKATTNELYKVKFDSLGNLKLVWETLAIPNAISAILDGYV